MTKDIDNTDINTHINWGSLHHANLVLGDPSILAKEVWLTLEDLDFKRVGNPDALNLELETLGIDEARELSSWSYKKPFGDKKVSVVSTNALTSEAQNALLKLFEEPPLETYFFLVTSNTGSILPTLMSRMRVLDIFGKSSKFKSKDNDKNSEASLFINSDISKRFKIINPIIKNKDKERARELVSNILGVFREFNSPEKLEMLFKAENYLRGRAPSIKMILENIAITL